MPTTRDYYEILSIERTADGEEVKRANRSSRSARFKLDLEQGCD